MSSNMYEKKVCKNNAKFFYTGKEASPLGLGWCSTGFKDEKQSREFKEGDRMMGRDGTMWMIGIKNNVRVWNRIPTELVELEKDAPLITAESNPSAIEEPKGPKEPRESEVPKEKKKLVVTKKKVALAKDEESEVSKEPKASDMPKEPKGSEAPKKKLIAKKKDPEETPKEPKEPKEPEAPAPKKLTDYHYFMSFRTKQVKLEHPEMDHRARFAMVSSEWKSLNAEEKKRIVEAAKKDDK